MSSSGTNSELRRRAPRGTLNQQVIVAAAIAVIDTDGLDAVTTRRLATDLGVRPMALYTHFPDKDAILRAVALELFGRFRMPERADSDLDLLGELMRAYFRLLIEHPVLVELDRMLNGTNDAEVRFSEAIYACLRRLRVPHRPAVGLVATMVRFVFGAATLYPDRSRWDEDPDYWERRRRGLGALPADEYPSLHELTEDLPTFTQWDAFEFGLTTLLGAVASAADV